MSRSRAAVECEECATSFVPSVKRTRVRWCDDCGPRVAQRDAAQAAELQRLHQVPGPCARCGDHLELDRRANARICYWCMAPSQVVDAVGEFASPGVWRVGPVVFDWDGQVSVARCEDCSGLNEWRWGERIARTAINHAKHWHEATSHPRRLLAPMRTVECDWPDCRAIVVVSEDYPERSCAAHREVAA